MEHAVVVSDAVWQPDWRGYAVILYVMADRFSYWQAVT